MAGDTSVSPAKQNTAIAEPDWKAIALYLASCHAGTTEYDGSLSSVSRARKDRLVSICRTTAQMIRGEEVIDDRHASVRTTANVLRRLDAVVSAQSQSQDNAPAK